MDTLKAARRERAAWPRASAAQCDDGSRATSPRGWPAGPEPKPTTKVVGLSARKGPLAFSPTLGCAESDPAPAAGSRPCPCRLQVQATAPERKRGTRAACL